MDFKTGNSGNTLTAAVLKRGPGCRQEGAFCQFLGPRICPEVYEILSDGYVMEALAPAERHPTLLRQIEHELEGHVWNRPALAISTDIPWQEKLLEYGVRVPSYPVISDPCLAHGDPTASNVLMRGRSYVLADPRPPRDFIPQCRETDMGRILQSFLGWESAAYGAPQVNWEFPTFMQDPFLLRSAYFWCGAAAARIEHLENNRGKRSHIIDWCWGARKFCGV